MDISAVVVAQNEAKGLDAALRRLEGVVSEIIIADRFGHDERLSPALRRELLGFRGLEPACAGSTVYFLKLGCLDGYGTFLRLVKLRSIRKKGEHLEPLPY